MSDLLRGKTQKQPCSGNQKPLDKKTEVKYWSTQRDVALGQKPLCHGVFICVAHKCNVFHTRTKPQEEGIELCHPTGYKQEGETSQ